MMITTQPRSPMQMIFSLKPIYTMPDWFTIDEYEIGMLKEVDYVNSQEILIEKMLKHLKINSTYTEKFKVLELGAGTGLFTEKLIKKLEKLKINDILIWASEPDKKYLSQLIKKLKKYIRSNLLEISQEKAEDFACNQSFDAIIICDSMHHIEYTEKEKVIEVVSNHLKSSGILLIGDEYIPDYSDEDGRKEALYKYYTPVVIRELEHRNIVGARLEMVGLERGLNKDHEFKESTRIFESRLKQHFKIIEKNKITPFDEIKCGGRFVYAAQKL